MIAALPLLRGIGSRPGHQYSVGCGVAVVDDPTLLQD